MTRQAAYIPFFAVFVWIGLLSAGCDTAVQPVDERFERTIAIHGFLDTDRDTQFVRVGALTPSAAEVVPEAHTVVVTARESGSGQMVAWKDSTVQTQDGSAGRLFFATFRPEASETWVLEAMRDGSTGAVAQTRIPDAPAVIRGEVFGDSINYTIPIELTGVIRTPFHISVFYEVVDPSTEDTVHIEIPYGRVGLRSGDNWRFDVFARRDRADLGRTLGLGQTGTSVYLIRMGARIELYSDEWSSRDDDPGLQSGHGFFASMGRYDVIWRLDAVDLAKSGFLDAQPPP